MVYSRTVAIYAAKGAKNEIKQGSINVTESQNSAKKEKNRLIFWRNAPYILTSPIEDNFSELLLNNPIRPFVYKRLFRSIYRFEPNKI